jgi:hypothetical protein
MPRLRTAKRAAGSTTPLEGKALTVAVVMVEPAPVKEEPTPAPCWREPRTPEQGAVGPPHTSFSDRLQNWTRTGPRSSPPAWKYSRDRKPNMAAKMLCGTVPMALL